MFCGTASSTVTRGSAGVAASDTRHPPRSHTCVNIDLSPAFISTSKPRGGACTGTGANPYLRRRSRGPSSEPLCQHPRPTTPNPLAHSGENGPRPEGTVPLAPRPSRRRRRQSLASHSRRSEATNACHILPLTCIVHERKRPIFIALSNHWRNVTAAAAPNSAAVALPSTPMVLLCRRLSIQLKEFLRLLYLMRLAFNRR